MEDTLALTIENRIFKIHTQHIHDRFLIIDEKALYHIGASIKDLGKKWFAFSRLDSLVREVLRRILKNGEKETRSTECELYRAAHFANRCRIV